MTKQEIYAKYIEWCDKEDDTFLPSEIFEYAYLLARKELIEELKTAAYRWYGMGVMSGEQLTASPPADDDGDYYPHEKLAVIPKE